MLCVHRGHVLVFGEHIRIVLEDPRRDPADCNFPRTENREARSGPILTKELYPAWECRKLKDS